jgi:PAS domain S-box-containing protein
MALWGVIRWAFGLDGGDRREPILSRLFKRYLGQTSLRNYDELTDQVGVGLVALTTEGEVLSCNDTYVSFTGRTSKADVVGHNASEWVEQRYLARIGLDRRNVDASFLAESEIPFRHPDGSTRWLQSRSIIQRSRFKDVIVAALTDVTSHREAKKRLKLCEQAFSSSADAIAITAGVMANTSFIYVNPAYERLTGYTMDELRTQSPMKSLLEDRANSVPNEELVEQLRRLGTVETTFEVTRKGGHRFLQRAVVSRMSLDEDSDDEYFVTVCFDVTEAERLARMLRLQSRAIEASQSGLMICRVAGNDSPLEVVNKAFEKITGYSATEVIGRDPRFLQGPDTDPVSLAAIRIAVREGKSVSVVFKNYRKDGTPFWNDMHVAPVKDETGRITHFIGVIGDVTERRDNAVRMGQLQKLKAIGDLTGGVAHDFNNLLTVIVGNLRLLEMSTEEPALRKRIALALSAAQRGSDLTQRLTAYARTQQLKEEVLEVNDLIKGLEPMLHRTLGAHIEIKSVLEDRLWSACVDRSQLENAILNLVINARDAMEGGGTLTITTHNAVVTSKASDPDLKPGQYVQVVVSDTGCGMTADVRERAFEPFFTTKEVGKGTGLGLSSVYGFVKQSGGHIFIYSELGLGTSIKIYLPRSTKDVPATEQKTQPQERGAGEIILLVEDDSEVRGTTSDVLEKCGYQVIEATSVQEAMEILGRRQDVALVLSDIIMPGRLTGYDLYKLLQQNHPGLPVLLTSGYPRDAIPRSVSIDDVPAIIAKPFDVDELSRVLRQELTRASAANSKREAARE